MTDRDSSHGNPLGPSIIVADTARLIPGIKLNKPLYDSVGTLLLDAEQTITEPVKQILLARHIERVLLSPEDVDAVRLDSMTTQRSLSHQVTVSIHETIEATADVAAALLRMTGVPLKDKVVAKCMQPYDPEFANQLAAQFTASSKLIERSLRTALQGVPGTAGSLNTIAQGLVGSMVHDLDQVIGSSVHVADAKPLVQRSLRMALLGMAAGIEMGLDAAGCLDVGLCALIQDWGIFRLPERMWSLSEPFSTQDWELYMRHPEFTGNLLDQMTSLSPAVKIAATQVHELCDGSGYPRGLTRNRIHVYARILAPIDAYVCLAEARRGRPALVPHDALACLLHRLPARCFDPQVLPALLAAISLFPLGSYVRLSDGREAQVIRRSARDYSKPVVECLRVDSPHIQGVPTLAPTIVDLSESPLEVVDIVAGKGEMRLDRSLMRDIVWDGPAS